MQVPLSKPIITEETKRRVLEVLDSGKFVKGENVKEFENKIADYCGVEYGIATSSGTAAIYLALRTLDIKQGDEVIVPSHTFIATVEPILMLGAKPVFVDIGNEYNMDIEEVERRITKKTKAVICVHLYGQMCDMDNLIDLKERHGFYLIEDAAQAIGAEYKSKKAGSFGDLGCFSFFPSKGITVGGEGGMIVTNRGDFAERLSGLRDHGREGKYRHIEVGFNFRMGEIAGVIGTEQLKHLDEWIVKRREIAKLYSALLTDEIIKPKEQPDRKHSYHLYVIRSRIRDEIRQYLKSKGISTGIHYPIPIHLQKVCKYLNYKKRDFPITEKYVNEILSLPIYPELKNMEIERVCETINEYTKKAFIEQN